MVEFTLDGKRVTAPEGELLVHAAARYGTFIPTLCHDDKLDPYGGCRMCLVDLEGAPRPVPACAQRVREGMVVSTNGTNDTLRKTLTEMLLAETMRFFAEESCQKCTPCRIGNRALHHHFAGGLELSPEKMDEWLEAMEQTSICGLGQAAPIPVRAALRHWPELFAPLGESQLA